MLRMEQLLLQLALTLRRLKLVLHQSSAEQSGSGTCAWSQSKSNTGRAITDETRVARPRSSYFQAERS